MPKYFLNEKDVRDVEESEKGYSHETVTCGECNWQGYEIDLHYDKCPECDGDDIKYNLT